MTTTNTFEAARKLLKKHNQGHVLVFWPELTPAQGQSLLAQVRELDFEQIDQCVANFVKKSPPPPISPGLAPAPAYPPQPINHEQERKYSNVKSLGEKLISSGKVAALVVAGGQGTRLGFDGPKGNFPISPIKNKALFQIFAETIAAAGLKYSATCHWYIMTSPLNHAQTVKIFRKSNYYGLSEKDVFIFQQGTLPNFDFNGKILLADKAAISCSPDGHGGTLKALHKSGALSDMKKRGIEYLSYWQIDNPLVNIFDSLFIGLHAVDGAEMSSKALVKADPYEKVGNFCFVDGKVTVIEYSDLPNELAEKRNPDGSLLFQLGSIAIHVISVSFVERLKVGHLTLPLHRAVKKIPYIDLNGNPVNPSEPNGTKLETFIFDALPLASNSVVLETVRSEEFSPTKNATGPDSAETTRRMMVARAADWLESAGVAVPRKLDGSPDCLIEITPSFALDKEDVKAKRNQIPAIKPGDCVYLA